MIILLFYVKHPLICIEQRNQFLRFTVDSTGRSVFKELADIEAPVDGNRIIILAKNEHVWLEKPEN